MIFSSAPPVTVIIAGLFALATAVFAPPVDAQSSAPPARDSSFNTGWRFSREEVTGGSAVTGWRWAAADPKAIDDAYGVMGVRQGPPAPDAPVWQPYTLGSDVLGGKRGFTWFQTTLPATPGPDRVGLVTRLELNAPSMEFIDAQLLKGIKRADNNWLVLLNGHLVSRQSGNSGQIAFDLNDGWHNGGANVLTILVDNVSAMQGGLGDARIADRTTPTQMAAGFNDSGWEKVVLPHTPRIETYRQYFPWQGLCWYRKTVTPPASWVGRRISLEFQGAMQVAQVWVNGESRLTHYGGFLPFTLDLTHDVCREKRSSSRSAWITATMALSRRANRSGMPTLSISAACTAMSFCTSPTRCTSQTPLPPTKWPAAACL